MPELPEAETIRRGLQKYLPGKTVAKVTVKERKLIRVPACEEFIKRLTGQAFTGTRRIGKIVILDLEKDSILVRLGMTGQLTFRDPKSGDTAFKTHPVTKLQTSSNPVPDKHTHIIAEHTDGTMLCYRDIRKFGKWLMYAKDELWQCPEIQALGPDPLSADFTCEKLCKSLARTSRSIKTALLDQSIVCGIGNIYADEILFACGISPLRQASSLTEDEISRIACQTPAILEASISRNGTTFSDYRDADGNPGENVGFLQVYGRSGSPCPSCGQILKREVVGGRGTSWCERCQH